MKRFLAAAMMVLAAALIFTAFAEGDAGEKEYTYLAKGSKGDEVSALQQRLSDLGYNVGSIDGDYGGKTKKAVELFQSFNGLEKSGTADEDTQAVLFSDQAFRNLEDLKGVSIVDEMESILKKAPDLSHSETSTFEYCGKDIEKYRTVLNVTDPQNLSISHWLVEIIYDDGDGQGRLVVMDESRAYTLTFKKKGKLDELAEVLRWEIALVEEIPDLIEEAEENNIEISKLVLSGVDKNKSDSDFAALADENGEIDLSNANNRKSLLAYWKKTADMAAGFASLANSFAG